MSSAMTASAERRTQAQRREATRGALIGAGRELFGDRGYDAVSSEEIVAAAGVTRGALYHHFEGKAGLFDAVLEEAEAEIVSGFDLADLAGDDPLGVMVAAAEQFLDLSLDSRLQQITLIDGPAVVGWERWHEIEERHGLGLIAAGLAAAREAGQIRDVPVPEVALMLLGAFMEAALQLARADDQPAARDRAVAGMTALIEGLGR